MVIKMNKILKYIVSNKEYILYLFLLFPFLEPAIFGNMQINKFFLVWKIISVLFLAKIVVFDLRFKISKVNYLIIAYEMVLLLSTIYNKGDIIDCLGDFLAVISLCMLVEIALKKFGVEKSLKPVVYIFLIFSFINLLDVFIHFSKDFVYTNYFLGIDNRFIFYFLPMISFSMIIEHYNENFRVVTFLCFILSLFTVFYTWSAGALIGLSLLFVYYVLFLKRDSKIVFKYNTLFFLILLLNILLVVFNFHYIFSDIIVNILHKNVNLSGRVFLWEKGLEMFVKKPLIGYGLNKEFLMSYLWGLNHYHNYFLNCLYQTGIFGFLLIIILNLFLGFKLNKLSNIDKSLTKIIISTIIVCLILSLVDTLDYPFFYVFYVIGYNLFEIKKNNKKKCVFQR